MSWSTGAAPAARDVEPGALPRLAVIEHRVWRLTAAGAVVSGVDGGDARMLAIDGARAVVGAGGCAWLRTAGAVLRFTPEGDAAGAVAVARRDDGLTSCRIGDGAVVLQGAPPVWIDPGGARELGAATGHVIPVGAGVVQRIGRGFAMTSGAVSIALAAPSDLAANAQLCGGASLRRGTAVGLELRSRGAHHLVVIDLRTRRATLRLRLTGARALVWVEERAHAVVVRAGELAVLDLESGRCIATRRFDEPIREVAVDERGEHIAAVCETRQWVADYAELVGSAPPPRRAAVPAPATLPPELGPAPDEGGLLDAGAARDEGGPRDAGAARDAGIDADAGDAQDRATLGELARTTRPSSATGAAGPAHAAPSSSLSASGAAVTGSDGSPARAALPGAAARAPEIAPPWVTRRPLPAERAVAAPAAVRPAGGEPILLGLAPIAPRVPEPELAGFLADGFALIGGMCRRAIAEAWDSGRFGTGGVLPYADELAATLDGADGRTPEALDLARQRERAAELGFARRDPAELPLGTLAAEHGLSGLAARIALIVAAPRMWPELARIYAMISNDRGRPLVDELLVAQLLGIGRADRGQVARELGGDAPLLRHGIVVRGAGERAFAALSVPAVVAQRLAGDRFDGAVGARAATVGLDELLAPRGRLAALRAALAVPPASPVRVVVRGRTGSGRRTLAAALAATVGRRAGLVDVGPADDGCDARLRDELRDAALRGHLPCVSGLDTLGDEPAIRVRLARVLDDHPGPLVVRCEPGAHPPLAPGFSAIDLEGLEEADRAAGWRGALGRHGLDGAAAPPLARRWAVGPGTATRAAAMVARDAGAVELDDAVRRLRADRLAGLADRVDRLATWSDLILPDDMIDSLRELIARVRHRDAVLRGWGMERVCSSARALTALFQGGPGTGKTLAAGVLARELGYELYRVDISRVMSRWLGETEKNLARIFDAAADGETILLFDEADTLFGRRTEVKSSHDRYANVETNYLLQRLDSWTGMAILTTNFGTSIDPAFRRRLTLQLQFPFPDDGERERLWRAHLPDSVPVAGDLDLAALAGRFKLSGGYIRNAALRACYLAAGAGSALTADHLVRAIQLEYRDMAKVAEGGRLE